MQQQIDELKNKKPGGKRREVRKMTYDEKRELSNNIGNLPGSKMAKVVEIIRKRNPSALGGGEEVEVDIDVLDAVTLRDLDKYVRECLGLPQPKRQTPKPPNGKGATPAPRPMPAAAAIPQPPSSSSSDAESDSDSEEEALLIKKLEQAQAALAATGAQGSEGGAPRTLLIHLS